MQLIFRRHHARQRELRAQNAAAREELAEALARAERLDELEQDPAPMPDPTLAHNAHERRRLESQRREAERLAYDRQFDVLRFPDLERPPSEPESDPDTLPDVRPQPPEPTPEPLPDPPPEDLPKAPESPGQADPEVPSVPSVPKATELAHMTEHRKKKR